MLEAQSTSHRGPRPLTVHGDGGWVSVDDLAVDWGLTQVLPAVSGGCLGDGQGGRGLAVAFN